MRPENHPHQHIKITLHGSAYGGQQPAPTSVGHELGKSLSRKERIRINIFSCRVKCYNCWQCGHQKRNCENASKRNLCSKEDSRGKTITSWIRANNMARQGRAKMKAKRSKNSGSIINELKLEILALNGIRSVEDYTNTIQNVYTKHSTIKNGGATGRPVYWWYQK